jgi:hypothetical protein
MSCMHFFNTENTEKERDYPIQIPLSVSSVSSVSSVFDFMNCTARGGKS